MSLMDINRAYVPACGIYCGDCEYLGKQCEGCGLVQGKPFWADQVPGGVCPIHDCCCNKKELEHCGLCPDFPCKIFTDLRDPGMSDEEFTESLSSRKCALATRTEIGTDMWLIEKAKPS